MLHATNSFSHVRYAQQPQKINQYYLCKHTLRRIYSALYKYTYVYKYMYIYVYVYEKDILLSQWFKPIETATFRQYFAICKPNIRMEATSSVKLRYK